MHQSRGPTTLYDVDSYFGLVHSGDLSPDDRVELLDGIIVAEPPQNPRHASGISRAAEALRAQLSGGLVIRVQQPMIVGTYSVPEPDVAIVPGTLADYDDTHPTTALLVVEVADSTLQQDRLSKSRIYAGAGIPECWLVNLAGHCVEIFRRPDSQARLYQDRLTARSGDSIASTAIAGPIAVDDLLPHRSDLP